MLDTESSAVTGKTNTLSAELAFLALPHTCCLKEYGVLVADYDIKDKHTTKLQELRLCLPFKTDAAHQITYKPMLSG